MLHLTRLGLVFTDKDITKLGKDNIKIVKNIMIKLVE
jgi:hypothetical protein